MTGRRGSVRERLPSARRDRTALGTAGVLLLVTVLLALPDGVAGWERWLFRLGNGTALPLLVLWPVMQLGNLLAVPLAAALALATRHRRLSAELLAAGLAAYVLAKVLKRLVDRERPAGLLDGVHLVGEHAGRGLPSGHAAVAAALVYVALPHLGRRARRGAVLCVALVCLGRLAVGAHLPLDVVAGVALGVALGALTRLLPSARAR